MGCACKLKQYERICYDVKYHRADWMFFGIWTKLDFVFRWNKNGILFKGETIWNERHFGLNVTTITTTQELKKNEGNLYRVHAERDCLVNLLPKRSVSPFCTHALDFLIDDFLWDLF